MTNNIKKIPHYTESFFYELKQTARMMKFHANQMFEILGLELTPGEYCTLDTIMCNPNFCQRDLSKLLLLDRANTGRILDKLEKLGYISRSIDTKNNRLVKKVEITKKGINELEKINNKIIDKYQIVMNEISEDEFENTRLSIKKLRENLEKHIESKI